MYSQTGNNDGHSSHKDSRSKSAPISMDSDVNDNNTGFRQLHGLPEEWLI
jgi:hypothetical protein